MRPCTMYWLFEFRAATASCSACGLIVLSILDFMMVDCDTVLIRSILFIAMFGSIFSSKYQTNENERDDNNRWQWSNCLQLI